MHDLLLQMVPGELNDELITSDAMRWKLEHGIGLVLQKCYLLICIHTYTILPGPECLPSYIIRACKWLALLARVGFGSPVHGLGPPA